MACSSGSAALECGMTEQWTAVKSEFHDGRADYTIKRNGQVVGRIHERMGGMVRKSDWAWFLNKLFPINFNENGSAESLGEAKDAFRRSWERAVELHGIEKIEAALDPAKWRAYAAVQAE